MFVIQHYKFNTLIANHQIFNYLIFIELTLIMSGINRIFILALNISLLHLLALTAGCSSKNESGHSINTRQLNDTVAKIIAEYPAEIGVALIVDNTDTIAVNDHNIYPMMSVFKLHQALAVCKDFDENDLSLDTLMTLRRGDLDPSTWSPMLKEHFESEIRLPVKDLLRYALIQSDNNTSNFMFKNLVGIDDTDSFIATLLPRECFKIAYTEEEMSADHDKAYSNTTSPLAAAMLINRLFTDSPVSGESQKFIINALHECKTGQNRIAAPLLDKPGVTIAHKTGSGYTTEDGILVALNDVAYITLPNDKSYALAVFVKDFKGNESEAAKAIARISSAVYTLLSDI